MAKVTGVDKLLRQFDKYGEDASKVAAGEVEAGARDISAIAKKNAPANFGKLRQGIQPEKVNELSWEVIAKEAYSGYVEFGTGVRVVVPKEMQDIAKAIQGNPRGTFDEFIESIKDWCEAKGIVPNIGVSPDEHDFEEMYFLIAQSILHDGLRPRPFMYPAWIQGGAKMFNKLEKSLEVLNKRFNNAR